MDTTREIIDRGVVAIAGQKILEVGGSAELRTRWPGVPELDARRDIVARGSSTPTSTSPGAAPVERHPR